MRLIRWLLATALCCCLASSPNAQLPIPPGFWKVTPPVSYTGPGDIVSGATLWYGLRAYNAAYATGTNKAVNIKNGTTSETCDLLITTAGNIGNTTNCSGSSNGETPATFAGTDATCTGTISSTTLTITSCASGTVRVFDQISGAGITQPAYITVIGSCSTGAGTCTLNAPQTVAVGETITFSGALFIETAYDQTGNGHDLTSASSTERMYLNSCYGALPCLGGHGPGAASFLTSGAFTTVAVPWSVETVYGPRIKSGSNNIAIFGTNPLATGVYTFGGNANEVFAYAGNTLPFNTATDTQTHVLQGIVSTGSAIGINIDNTLTSLSGAGNTGYASPVIVGPTSTNTGDSFALGEGGLWPSAFNSTQQTNMCHNAFAYWGTSVSC